MKPAALHKIPTQTIDSSQVLAKCLCQKQQQKIKSITKNWDKNTIIDLQQVCPKQDHNLLLTFWSSKKVYPNWYYRCDQASSFERSKFQK